MASKSLQWRLTRNQALIGKEAREPMYPALLTKPLTELTAGNEKAAAIRLYAMDQYRKRYR